MTLSQWIDETGNKKLAKRLKIEPSTISSWKNYDKFPRPKMLKIIHQASEGQVTYESMVEEYLKRNRKK